MEVTGFEDRQNSPQIASTPIEATMGSRITHYGLIICPLELQQNPHESNCLDSFRVNSQLLWWDLHPLDLHNLSLIHI